MEVICFCFAVRAGIHIFGPKSKEHQPLAGKLRHLLVTVFHKLAANGIKNKAAAPKDDRPDNDFFISVRRRKAFRD